jgi:pSer/pThr/pTyr-binding forkhead associated (FHA) protein
MGSGERTVVYHVTRPDRDPAVLVKGRSLKIGRHPSNDVVLRHVSVSRHHATLKWEEGASLPMLVDEGSANGVQAEGERIDGSVSIGSQTRVEIGEVEVTVKPVVLTSPSSESTRLPIRGVAQGKFDDPGKIHRMLIRVEERAQSGTLRLASQSARYEICLREGRIVSASSADGELVGEIALKLALSLEAGAYRFALKNVPAGGALDLSAKEFVEGQFSADFDAAERKTARWAGIASRVDSILGDMKAKGEKDG